VAVLVLAGGTGTAWAKKPPKTGLSLVPAAYGPGATAEWRKHQGLPDSKGGTNEALYLAKTVPTATDSAATAQIVGMDGQPVSSIANLSWEHRTDGHCGAGAPRWAIFVQGQSGTQYNVALGCAAAAHTPGGAANWIRDSWSGSVIQAAIANAGGSDASNGTISGLFIVFDEGNDVGPGFVYLDNITVNDHVWTSSRDNG
jgi:hypothetical protein